MWIYSISHNKWYKKDIHWKQINILISYLFNNSFTTLINVKEYLSLTMMSYPFSRTALKACLIKYVNSSSIKLYPISQWITTKLRIRWICENKNILNIQLTKLKEICSSNLMTLKFFLKRNKLLHLSLVLRGIAAIYYNEDFLKSITAWIIEFHIVLF